MEKVGVISPMLATLIEKPFDRKGWIFEIKWDGYRAFAEKKLGKVSLISRGQKSFNAHFPTIVDAVKTLPGSFLLDGEIVVFDAKEKTSFQMLQNYLKRQEGRPLYFVFDILFYNGKDLREKPLIERKAILRKLVRNQSLIIYNDHVEERGKALFTAAKKGHFEGIIAKKADSTYQSSRSLDWRKIKAKKRQEVVIGGFTEPQGSRKKFGALLVGVYERGKLIYAGHVGGGFNAQLLADIYEELQKKITKTCPFAKEPKTNTPATWVLPKLVCEVEFQEWTSDGRLRQPIFKGLRFDKPTKSVGREVSLS